MMVWSLSLHQKPQCHVSEELVLRAERIGVEDARRRARVDRHRSQQCQAVHTLEKEQRRQLCFEPICP